MKKLEHVFTRSFSIEIRSPAQYFVLISSDHILIYQKKNKKKVLTIQTSKQVENLYRDITEIDKKYGDFKIFLDKHGNMIVISSVLIDLKTKWWKIFLFLVKTDLVSL